MDQLAPPVSVSFVMDSLMVELSHSSAQARRWGAASLMPLG